MIKFRDYQKPLIRDGIRILKQNRIVYYAVEMRLGKTLISLETARLLTNGRGDVLFITTKKNIPNAQDDYEKANWGFSLTVINYESLHKVPNINYDVVIIDEAHNMGAFPRKSQRTERVKKYVKKSPAIFLSGTPTPESFSQLYHQLWVTEYSPWKGYKTFYEWARHYVSVYTIRVGSFTKNRYDRADKAKVMKDISHLVVSLSQKQAGFNQEITEKVIRIPMPERLYNIYREIDKEGVYIADKWAIAISGAADKINKLSQICGGAIIADNGLQILSKSKALAIKEKFKGRKYAIFYKYQGERHILERVFDGEFTTDPQEFQNTDVKIFLGQIRSIREGVDLKAADCLVFHNIDFSATSYYQARARLQTKDREKPALVYWMFYDKGIENHVYKAVHKKKNFTWAYYKRHRK